MGTQFSNTPDAFVQNNSPILAGQTAVITGAARGIGRQIALCFAHAGAQLWLCDLPDSAVETTAREIAESTGITTRARFCDVRDETALQALTKEIAGDNGPDIWVNNAGVREDQLMLRMSGDSWDRVLDVNLKGAFLGTRIAAKAMMKQRRGKIINIGSNAGTYGNAGQANYAASKAGLAALTKQPRGNSLRAILR